MTVEGNLRSAMSTLYRLYPEEIGGIVALKVLKDQMNQQQQLISELTRAGLHFQSYDNSGKSLLASSPLHVDRTG